jgi:cytochrome c oxidase cbb3-type subunit 1
MGAEGGQTPATEPTRVIRGLAARASDPRAEIAAAVRRHALAWLVAANAVGVLLAAELLWPALGDALAPLGYGRWMPLHLDWQLYGWCALPLAGVLLAWTCPPARSRAAGPARFALAGWSAALALGGGSWLAGVVSGKLFQDWHGWARPLLPLAMLGLWGVLAWQARQRRGLDPAPVRRGRAALLAVLLAVPPLLWWSGSRTVYPPVNPDSGGATGAALLGSTLAVLGIFGLLPAMLGVGATPAARDRRARFWAAWAVSAAAWAAAGHGDTSHHAASQITALGITIAWVPLLAWFWRGQSWCAGARPWMVAALGWWALLAVSGWTGFLPGISERLKFTNGLVAHAHLAMAGLITSVNGLILNQLDPARPIRRGFGAWQAATAVHVVVLLAIGWMEGGRPAEFFAGADWVGIGYGVRLAAGVVMTIASAQWLREAWR